MTITKVLIPLENIRLFYRIQRNIDRSFKYNTRKDGACGSFFIELMEETKKKTLGAKIKKKKKKAPKLFYQTKC